MARVPQGKKIVGNTILVDDFLGDILASSSDYSIVGNDLKGKITSWNEGARRLYGYEPQEIIGRASEVLYTPKEVEDGLPQKMLQAVLEHGKWEGTITRMRRNGVKFPAHTMGILQRDAKGKPIGMLLISKSLSFETRLSKVKRLLDNKILGNNEEVIDFLGNILESSTEYSMIGKDLEGNIILWN
jgi:PAS domain S-box-containing protein